jgi:sulfur carrier protein
VIFNFLLAMLITVNGDSREVDPGTTVRSLLEQLGLTSGPVAVERNREVVPRAEHETTALAEGDVLEVVHFVGGG